MKTTTAPKQVEAPVIKYKPDPKLNKRLANVLMGWEILNHTETGHPPAYFSRYDNHFRCEVDEFNPTGSLDQTFNDIVGALLARGAGMGCDTFDGGVWTAVVQTETDIYMVSSPYICTAICEAALLAAETLRNMQT